MGQIDMKRCYCGAAPRLESFISLKFGFLGKGKMTAWRVVCSRCDEGRFNLRGSPTREKAIEHWNQIITSWEEVIAESVDMPDEKKSTLG